MADLKTDYKDDVLDTTQNTKRKYQMIDNGDGTVSFEDVTEYIQQGDSFGADDINDTNEEVNNINDNLNNWIKYADVIFENVTFTNQAFINIASSKPTIQGYTMVIAVVLSASAALSSPGDYPVVEANGNFLIGTIGKTYTKIIVRYLYVHDEIT